MSQNNLVIDNQSFPTTRADINSALQALGSLNSGSSAPTTTYANMLWYDTSANTLKMRAEANDVWISVGYLDQSDDAFRIFDDTLVVNSSGTQTGLIGDQDTSAWESGTSTTESLVSPAKVKAGALAAVEDEGPIKAFANFDGTDATIRKSKNIQSIVRNGGGLYTVTFNEAMGDANYIISGTCRSENNTHPVRVVAIKYGTTPSTTSFELSCGDTGGDSSAGRVFDSEYIHFSIIG